MPMRAKRADHRLECETIQSMRNYFKGFINQQHLLLYQLQVVIARRKRKEETML
jgi:hypothetical protein